jgi:acyl dehydratase
MKRYWDQTEIGDVLPTIAKLPISRLQIAQFAAAADEFSPLNLDDEQARAAGFNGAYAPGLMALGFAEEALKGFASNMRILSLTGTFQRLIWPGDLLVAKGLVLRRYQKNNEHRIQLSLWCENQNHEVVMKGSSVCLLFKNTEHETKSQSSQPLISSASHEALLKRCAHLMNEASNKAHGHPVDYKELV